MNARTCLLILLLCCLCLPACGETQTLAAPALPGSQSREMLKNPDRGFRLETYMNVGTGKYTPGTFTDEGDYLGPEASTKAAGWLVNFFYDYKPESPTVAQVYFYLTEYRDRDLDDTAISNMTEYFAMCRKLNITVALRFAYVFTQFKDEKQDCVSLEQMLRHMEQLKPLLAENRDVLFVLESGFFGEWGECTGASQWVKTGQAGQILDAVVRMCPEDLPIVTRYQWVRDLASPALRGRIGYHDDYVTGYSCYECVGGLWDSDLYAVYLENSPRVVVEGEMPWGAQSEELDPWSVAEYLARHHFAALSCYHNYREGGGIFCLRRARDMAVTPESLAAHGLRAPYDAWFKDAEGQPLSRSLYDYIREFLGYHIAAGDASATLSTNGAAVSLTLTNFGFAAPLALRGCDLVLLDENDQVLAAAPLCALSALAPGEQVVCEASLTADGARYVGVKLYNAAGTGAKLANDLPFRNGVNILAALGE